MEFYGQTSSMDNNTLQVSVALITSIQVIALAFIAYKGRHVPGHVEAIANGLTVAKDQAQIEAAAKVGELRGRDWQAGITPPVDPTATP